MRFFAPAVALFASLALAQYNAINIPPNQSTLDITAGQPQTITWTNPSSGTVTVKLQESGPNISPDSGITLASGVPASDGTATFTIDPSQVNSFQYTIEIIDDTNPANMNFSPNFGIPNAKGTATGNVTGSATASSTSGSPTDSSSVTGTTDSTASITSSASATDSTASSSETASTITDSSSNSASSTTSSAAATESTSAPSSDDASGIKIQGSLVALVAFAVALL